MRMARRCEGPAGDRPAQKRQGGRGAVPSAGLPESPRGCVEPGVFVVSGKCRPAGPFLCPAGSGGRVRDRDGQLLHARANRGEASGDPGGLRPAVGPGPGQLPVPGWPRAMRRKPPTSDKIRICQSGKTRGARAYRTSRKGSTGQVWASYWRGPGPKSCLPQPDRQDARIQGVLLLTTGGEVRTLGSEGRPEYPYLLKARVPNETRGE